MRRGNSAGRIAAVTYRRRRGMRWGKAMLRYMRRSRYPWWRSQGALSLDNTAMQAALREMYERCQPGGNELTFPGIEWVEVDPADDVVLELTPTLRVGKIHVIAKAPGDVLPGASGGGG